jgi:RTX calcium-binding nonapeptide repeat (4 copies)
MRESTMRCRPIRTASAAAALALVAAGVAAATSTSPYNQRDGLWGTAPYDRGLYVFFCPHKPRQARTTASAASTSEAGWPKKECLKMDKGPAGRSHTLVGLDGVHNWLLGGYGNDTIVGGDDGDVIWGDYHPNRQPPTQTVTIHAGNGRNVIYANDTHNYVWTGTNPHTVVHAYVSGIDGVIHCQSRYIVVYLSRVSQRHFKLDGCRRISHYSVGY